MGGVGGVFLQTFPDDDSSHVWQKRKEYGTALSRPLDVQVLQTQSSSAAGSAMATGTGGAAAADGAAGGAGARAGCAFFADDGVLFWMASSASIAFRVCSSEGSGGLVALLLMLSEEKVSFLCLLDEAPVRGVDLRKVAMKFRKECGERWVHAVPYVVLGLSAS